METETKQQKEPKKKFEISNEGWLLLKIFTKAGMLLHK